MPYYTSYSVYFSFYSFCCFSPQSRSYKVYFSYLVFFTVSYHMPCPTVCVSHFISYHASFSFSSFVGFLAIFQVLKCEFLLFLFGEFYCYNPDPTVCISHFSRFHFFSPDSKSYSVCVLFSTFFSFLSTIQFLQCEFLIFKVFHCFLP